MQRNFSMFSRVVGASGWRLVVVVPLIWLAVFFLLPLLETLQVSFTTAQRSVPPYAPLWGFDDNGFFTNFTLENYGLIATYWQDYIGPAGNSIKLAFFSNITVWIVCPKFEYIFLIII
mgnify:CR=1 FL=1